MRLHRKMIDRQLIFFILFLFIFLNGDLQPQVTKNTDALQVDLSSPEKMQFYLSKECELQHYDLVKNLFRNTAVFYQQKRVSSSRLSLQFCYVWQHSFVAVKADDINNKQTKTTTTSSLLIGHLVLSELHNAIPVYLIRRERAGRISWNFSSTLLRQIPKIFGNLGGHYVEQLPQWLRGLRFIGLELWQFAGIFLMIGVSFFLSWLVSIPLLFSMQQLSKRTALSFDKVLIQALRLPLILFLTLGISLASLRWLYLELEIHDFIISFLQSALIVILCWFLMRVVETSTKALERRIQKSGTSSHRDRSLRTRIVVLHRLIDIVLLIIATGLILTRFEVLRKIGLSLLASAGIAGVILGFAAQKTFANLLAGVQLAISQPARIGDTVVIDGEYGKVEEIHLTYLVIKLWDLRRLVVPIQRFLDHSFENWTRNQPAMFATVSFFADYKVPVGHLREKFEHFVKNHKLWDGEKCSLIIQEATDRALKLRCMVSAKDASDVGTLKLDTLEFMIDYLSKLDNGKYLPISSPLDS